MQDSGLGSRFILALVSAEGSGSLGFRRLYAPARHVMYKVRAEAFQTGQVKWKNGSNEDSTMKAPYPDT